MFMKLHWEQIQEETNSGHTTYRTPIRGGWLVAVRAPKQDGASSGAGGGLTFVADAQHEWMVDTIEIK
ncbi:hypothetical protein BE17_12315 [Sorangium cellulosum]|uniref:Uncharacterized protein n=1 Tax=Sorangium cellulosum TaxID=56 RepID=A0A150SKI0_SORCE|nr:hypothetical protein BE17_12315 [Sorangium cellulosum]